MERCQGLVEARTRPLSVSMEHHRLTTDRWLHVKHVFQTAVELAPTERAAYLADACGADPSLRAEVESLIAAHERPGVFLDTPACDLAAGYAIHQGDAMVGQTLNYYRI